MDWDKIHREFAWNEPKENFSSDTLINEYLNKRFPNQPIQNIYNKCIWSSYNWSQIQKMRLISYLLIKQDNLTIDSVLKKSWKKTDYNTKLALFNDYVLKWLIDSKKIWSLSYRWTMEQNLEMLHLLVQESFFWTINYRQSIIETQKQITVLQKDVVKISSKQVQKDQNNTIENVDKPNLTIVQPISQLEQWKSSFSLTWVEDIQLSSDTNNASDSTTVNIIYKNWVWINDAQWIMNEDLFKWSIDPKLFVINSKITKEQMKWICSSLIKRIFWSLWIPKDQVIVGDSSAVIYDLIKHKTWTVYRADMLTEELFNRSRDWKWNVYDAYFKTGKGHRVLLIVWNDWNIYVVDPYYAWKTPVKLLDYTLVKSPKWYRFVVIPNKDWYKLTAKQVKSNKIVIK